METETSVRNSFVEQFSEREALLVEDAAESHGNGINDKNRGTDPFKWAIAICIGYDCLKVDRYRKEHGITANWEAVKSWIRDKCDLISHDGDFDYLAMFAGLYSEFIPEEV